MKYSFSFWKVDIALVKSKQKEIGDAIEEGVRQGGIEMRAKGLRNNNLGNIRITKDKWQGLREKQTDKSFFQFSSMPYGYRVLIRTLQNYRNK